MTKRSEMRIIMKDIEKINNNMENDELEDDDLEIEFVDNDFVEQDIEDTHYKSDIAGYHCADCRVYPQQKTTTEDRKRRTGPYAGSEGSGCRMLRPTRCMRPG